MPPSRQRRSIASPDASDFNETSGGPSDAPHMRRRRRENLAAHSVKNSTRILRWRSARRRNPRRRFAGNDW